MPKIVGAYGEPERKPELPAPGVKTNENCKLVKTMFQPAVKKGEEQSPVQGLTVEGFPWLVVHRCIDDENNPRWSLSHVPSGFLIEIYPKRKFALETLWELAVNRLKIPWQTSKRELNLFMKKRPEILLVLRNVVKNRK